MALTKGEPRRFGLGSPFGELERFFDDFSSYLPVERRGKGEGFWHPKVDIFESGEYLMVKIDLTGLEEKDVHVTFDGHILTIQGERKEEDNGFEDGYYNRERFFGKFHRVLHLPEMVSAEGLKARYHHGVLNIEIPKKQEAKSKEIEVEMAG